MSHASKVIAGDLFMRYTNLGRSGLQVSRLCLGTMNFGPVTPEPESHRILDAALDAGVNFIDTANVYGRHLGPGATEEIVGRWLARGGDRRERTVLATKVFEPMGQRPNQSGLSAYHIKRACEESLRRLKTDHIDLYQMHSIDRSTPWEEVWQAMEQLVREGKVLYVGSSNFAGWHIAQAQAAAASRHFMGLVSEQSLYNLTDRLVEMEVVPACRHYGLGLLPWSPLAAGALAGLGEAAAGRRASQVTERRIERDRPAIERFESFCRELGAAPADVALAWLLHNPVVTAPVIGPRTLEQFQGNLRALELKLDAAALQKLDEIFPGPGLEAPEAYYMR